MSTNGISNFLGGRASEIAFSPDGARLYVAQDSMIRVINARNGALLDRYDFDHDVRGFDVSPDGNLLVVNLTPSGPLLSIDIPTGNRQTFVPDPDLQFGSFSDLAFLSDGTLLLSVRFGGSGGRLYDFDASSVTVIEGIGSSTLTPSLDRDEVLIVGTRETQIYTFEVGAGITSRRTFGPDYDPYAGASIPPPPETHGAISNDGNFILADREFFGSQFSSSDRLAYPMSRNDLGSVFSPDNSILYTLHSGLVVAYSTGTLQPFATYQIDSFADYFDVDGGRLRISNDGTRLAILAEDGIIVIDLQRAEPSSTDGMDILADGDVLVGLAGADTLGGEGPQRMYGGEGDDIYYIDTPSDRYGQNGDTIIEHEGEGYDIVYATSNATIGDNVEELIYIGTGSGRLNGNAHTQTLRGGDGDDRLDGRGGGDTLVGGLGDDRYHVWDADDRIVETADGGIDTAYVIVTSFRLPDHVENAIVGSGRTSHTVFGNEIANTITGNDYVDTIQGLSGNDVIYGRNGDDMLEGNDGDDLLFGDGGHDLLFGGSGFDTLNGGDGNDTLIGGWMRDDFNGGAGIDTVRYDDVLRSVTVDLTAGIGARNHAANDIYSDIENVVGSNWADIIVGNWTANELWGENGDDEITGMDGDDFLHGGGGRDFLYGDGGADTIHGENGSDRLYGGADPDLLYGGTGWDNLFGDSGDDRLFGDNGTDRLFGGNGSDFLAGGDHQDFLYGQSGDDRLIGDGGNDFLLGGNGNDTLEGSDGADVLHGGAGYDWLDGGDGADILEGSWGQDTLIGGDGADLFTFARGETGTVRATADVILDFSQGERDRIDLSAIDADASLEGDQAFTFVGDAAFSQAAGELRYSIDGQSTLIEADFDGDGVADFAILLNGSVSLESTDFIL